MITQPERGAMKETAFKWAPSIAFGLAGVGFDVSGDHNQTLATICWIAAVIFLVLPAWTYLKRIRIGLAPLNAERVEFFGTISELRERHPIHETFKPGNEIHAYFLSGEGVFAEHNDYIKCVKRLLLPKPDAMNLATLQTLSNVYADCGSQIEKTRALAVMNNVPVRLFQDFIGLSLLFCNPDRQDGWVQVGLIIPGSESSERQHYRIYRNRQDKAVRSLYKAFNVLWEHGASKTDEEKFHAGFNEGSTR
jgi:hypothetical protein